MLICTAASIIREYLQGNTSIDGCFTRLQEGNSALAWSAKHGHEEIVQRLLARGAYFNLPDKVSRARVLFRWGRGGGGVVLSVLIVLSTIIRGTADSAEQHSCSYSRLGGRRGGGVFCSLRIEESFSRFLFFLNIYITVLVNPPSAKLSMIAREKILWDTGNWLRKTATYFQLLFKIGNRSSS